MRIGWSWWFWPLTVVAVSPVSGRPQGGPLVEAFSSEIIKTSAQSWSVAQDDEGVLYFGCDALVSFDGDRWKSVRVPDAYTWRGLDFDTKGRLWAAAVGELGWFERNTGNSWTFNSLTQKLPASYARPGEIWYAFAVENHTIFVSADAVMRWDGTSFQVWPMPGTRRLLAARSGGKVYVHQRAAGLFVVEAAGPRKVIDAETLGFSASIFWMEPGPGGWLFATGKGLFRYAHGKVTPFAEEVARIGGDRLITSAVRLRDGRIVVGTFQGGLLVVLPDGRLEREIGLNEGLPTRSITSLFVDREGNLWAVSPTHILRISLQSQSTIFDKRSGLPEQPCLKIVRHEDRLFVSTQDGVYSMKESEARFLVEKELSQTPWIWDMRSTNIGLVTAGHHKVNAVVNGKMVDLHQTPNDVFVAVPSRLVAGSIIVADGKSVVSVLADGRTKEVVANLPDSPTSLAEDRYGRIWIGTNGRGAFFAVPGSDAAVEASAVGGKLGLSASTGVWRVAGGSDASVVLFGEQGGWLLDQERVTFIPIEAYPHRGIACFSGFGPEGTAWVVHPEEKPSAPLVGRVLIQRGRARWNAHAVEGLPAIGHPTAIFAEPAAGKAVTLWIGGARGILRHGVENGPEAPAPPVPIVRAVARKENGGPLRLVDGPLPYSTQSVILEFSSPQYARRASTRIENFVQGVDDDWQVAERGVDRELPAMRNGRYIVRVRSVAETGATSRIVEFPFSVDPPWWRTVPAGVGLAVVIVAIGGFAYRLRVRGLTQQNAFLEERVRQRTSELQIANAAKSQFVASISHDVRNPLNGIVGIAYALDDPALGPKHRERVAILRECSTYLSRLVEDVLDFSQIEAGKIELRPKVYSPADVVQSVASILQADAKSRNAELEMAVSPTLPKQVVGDSGRVQQVLVNFVSNAVKYVGGRILISAQRCPHDENMLMYAVGDDGMPFTREEEAQLFNMFTRLPGSQRDQVPGRGLGLAASRKIATAMGGCVGVECGIDRGKKFFLRVPLQVAEGVEKTDPTALPIGRVLVVEDQDYNAAAAAAVLKQLDLRCDCAVNGAEAIRMFSTGSYQVVLLDRSLPDMDGTEVARRMRAGETGGRHALVLAVTASCTTEDREACLAAGMDAFLGKPLTPEKLRGAFSAASLVHRSAASVQLPEDSGPRGLNLRLLEYLAEDSSVGVREQVERYLKLLESIHGDLSKAMSSGDPEGIVGAAHQLSGHAKIVGHAGLIASAGKLETAARRPVGVDLTDLKVKVDWEVANLRRSLTALSRSASPN